MIRLISTSSREVNQTVRGDLYIDVRWMSLNMEGLQELTGAHRIVQAKINSAYKSIIEAYMTSVLHGYTIRDRSRPWTVVVFCEFGVHRSVAVKHLLAALLRQAVGQLHVDVR